MKITIVGAGYVGFSLSLLLSQKNSVTILDTNNDVIESINKKKSPIPDKSLSEFLLNVNLKLHATNDSSVAYKNCDFIIVCVPTNLNKETGSFNTSQVESVIGNALIANKNATIIIKSTIPIGFTNYLRKKFSYKKIIFSPEFLIEGRSLLDTLNPSRIVIGSSSLEAYAFLEVLEKAMENNFSRNKVLFCSSKEAEAIKLFANSYLAMRVAFFNELDSFCEINKLNAKEVINGVCLDDRIGNYYNNPSFGYGGYCLPKDTKQLLYHFSNVEQSLIKAIVESNEIRKNMIIESITKKQAKNIGIYRLIMKQGSENFRESAIIGIIKELLKKGLNVFIYEPNLDKKYFLEAQVIEDLSQFKLLSDLILSNRLSDDLADVHNKVYSRDLYGTH